MVDIATGTMGVVATGTMGVAATGTVELAAKLNMSIIQITSTSGIQTVVSVLTSDRACCVS